MKWIRFSDKNPNDGQMIIIAYDEDRPRQTPNGRGFCKFIRADNKYIDAYVESYREVSSFLREKLLWFPVPTETEESV